ncbi:hypothetical protein [Leeuwenhoekiella nanhaiensis]|uniref:Uncharacterized protein n=1 Tax=Leeuwenhoekiella nanhaiensis TaxID=1655491 RepID=A0A2G1VMR0_9FLAO|nr:hypothetical protein [Leeuwenhoekiella nanhaiensis]PHQ28048.1 hypothetical protein CJ305_16660 [Leeuwenhoekiella nanhaiensis]
MKFKILILSILISNFIYSQSVKDSLLQKDIVDLVEEMEFMYGYDQILREYIIFKTFDKSETDRIENLPDSLRTEEMTKRRFKSDSIGKLIWKNYINPKDAEHTERMIEITKKYGFPSLNRIKKYYHEEFADPEFNPYILLVHAPKKYWEELKILMKSELDSGVISKCTYGHLLWHITGRKSFQPMLDNGYEMVVKNGKTTLKSTCN